MPDSSQKENLDIEMEQSVDKNEKCDETVSDSIKKNEDEKKEEEPSPKKPAKKIHNFFGI